MEQDFVELGFDPIWGTEVMELLGVPAYSINDHKTLEKVKDIVGFFEHYSDRRAVMLDLIKDERENKLDKVWTYTEIQKEKFNKLRQIPTEYLTQEMKEKIDRGEISNTEIKYLKETVLSKMREEETHKKMQEVFNFMDEEKNAKLSSSLDELSVLTEQLSRYG